MCNICSVTAKCNTYYYVPHFATNSYTSIVLMLEICMHHLNIPNKLTVVFSNQFVTLRYSIALPRQRVVTLALFHSFSLLLVMLMLLLLLLLHHLMIVLLLSSCHRIKHRRVHFTQKLWRCWRIGIGQLTN